MNIPPEEYIIVREDRLLAFVTACFEKSGVDADHAALISRLLVNNDLRGVRSHGSRAAHGYCRGFEKGSFNPHPDVRVVHETPSAVVVEGDGTLGYLPMVRAAEQAVAKAKETGVGFGLARHIGHYGSAGHYSRICLEHGCIGFSVQGHRNEAKAHGRNPRPLAPFSGDPPISFAFPAGDQPPIILDGGTNIFGPYHGPAYEDLFTRIPAAYFKSMGYIAVATLMGGILTGYTQPGSDEVVARWPGAVLGGAVLAVAVDRLMSGDEFRAEADRYIRDLCDTHDPMPGTDRVRLPGHIEAERMEMHRREGIQYGVPEQEAMRALHEHFGVPLPWD